MSGILTLRTGSPLIFTDGGVAINAKGNTETPNQIGPSQVLHGINTGNLWVSNSSFAHALPNTFGTLGRAVWSGQIRADSYDLTNTPFFSNPDTDINSQSFGYVTGTVGSGVGVNGFSSARSIQLAMKIVF